MPDENELEERITDMLDREDVLSILPLEIKRLNGIKERTDNKWQE